MSHAARKHLHCRAGACFQNISDFTNYIVKILVVMLDEILPLQLITAKLGGSIVSLEIEITSSMRHTESESTTGFFHLPARDLLLPLPQTLVSDRRLQWLLVFLPKDTGKMGCMKLPKFRNGKQVVLNPGSPRPKP